MIINVTPIGKPRMTRSDKWKLRDVVVRYRMFKDALRREAPELQGAVGDSVWLVFEIAMPMSWSNKKRLAMLGTYHQQKPDIDNLVKAFLDATLKDDSAVYEVHAKKVWALAGAIRYGEGEYAERSTQAAAVEEAGQSATSSESETPRVAHRGVAVPGDLRVRGVLSRKPRG